MKKKFYSIFVVGAFCFLHSCKTVAVDKYSQILASRDIALIEEFLQQSDKRDARRFALMPRLIALKNAELKKNTDKARQLISTPKFTDIPKNYRSSSSEATEFQNLMQEKTSGEHQKKTVKLLNAMFDQDVSSTEVILLVQNKSDCNMILRLDGKAFFNVAIPTRGENVIVLPKGDYKLSSNVCDVKYNSTKKITKNLMITLENPTVKIN